MKAILEYNGYTKMVEIHEPTETYYDGIQTVGKAYHEAMKSGDRYSWAFMMYPVRHKNIEYKLKDIKEVDGEPVAIYEFYEER